MNKRLVYIVLTSFLFAQVTCANSEALELYMEAVEHSSLASISHDISSEHHDEVAEHQEEMTGVSHCVHSHPPMTLIFDDTTLSYKTRTAYFMQIGIFEHETIGHRPPISPPKA